MTTPVILPPTAAELAVPYMNAAGFSAYPTWLDLDNLIPGGLASAQAAELEDVLLTASRWICSEPLENMRIDAHWVQGENQRTRVSGSGRLYLRPRDIPLRAITSFSYGWDPSAMSSLSLPDSSMWVEDGREVSFRPGGGNASFIGPAIQFGGTGRTGASTYVTWSYIAGYPACAGGLEASCNAGASEIEVADPTGILPGDVLRIYDPGQPSAGQPAAPLNEAVTVASGYDPALPTFPPTPAEIPLASVTTYAHAAGTMITGMPRDILQSQICYTVALLMREDVAEEAPAATSPFSPAARTTGGGRGGQAGGLVNDAYNWAARYAPVWRS
jgi:hypothetical protein